MCRQENKSRAPKSILLFSPFEAHLNQFRYLKIAVTPKQWKRNYFSLLFFRDNRKLSGSDNSSTSPLQSPSKSAPPGNLIGKCRICRKNITLEEKHHVCSNCHQLVCDDCSSYSSRDESKVRNEPNYRILIYCAILWNQWRELGSGL